MGRNVYKNGIPAAVRAIFLRSCIHIFTFVYYVYYGRVTYLFADGNVYIYIVYRMVWTTTTRVKYCKPLCSFQKKEKKRRIFVLWAGLAG